MTQSTGQLAGRVAIVTGASSGVGRGAARRFAEEGAKLVICARRTDKLQSLVEEIRASGGVATAVACDVLDEADIDKVVRTAVEEYGCIDVLANIAQAGMEDHRYLAETTKDAAIRDYLGGPVQSMMFMQKCFPYMKERGYGRIINTGSHSCIIGHPGFAPYEMAKGAMMALTRNASQEWAPYGIVTNIFLPVIRTEAFDMSEQGKAAARALEDSVPVGYFGQAYEDCSPVLVFLASEGARYINGQVIGVDGGKTLLA